MKQKTTLHAFTLIIVFLVVIYAASYYYGLLDMMSVLAFSFIATAVCFIIALRENVNQ